MATQYEIEHNVQFREPRRGRRVDMASFFSLLDQISGDPSSSGRDGGNTTGPRQHRQNNPHATPTPVDSAALFRMLQDQLLTLQSTAPTDGNREFLEQLISSLEGDINDPPPTLRGVSQEFVDTLDRVPRRRLAADDDCAICKVPYLEDH
ncbi:RING protein [Geosmithia morbida]|uniref:RING protein n=1 Tax=Geosmithia morbida TaxID=1094350 RepID=A0A9P4Z199_9HYPO|nr:RING protein [Geosmithia morbida]KAF4125576.1 RING protein [Geosmithia morbida]